MRSAPNNQPSFPSYLERQEMKIAEAKKFLKEMKKLIKRYEKNLKSIKDL